MTQTVPKGFVRAYLRASTTEQDATRALDTINTFAIERGLSICNYYIENESGSKLERPELFRLLKGVRLENGNFPTLSVLSLTSDFVPLSANP